MEKSVQDKCKSLVMLLTATCEVLGGLVLVQFSKSGHFSLALSGAVVTSIGMHALGLAQHESFHRLLFKSPKLNDNVGRVLCSWFLFTQFAPLKRLHLAHHRGFGLTADPDRWHWDGQRNSRQSLGLLFQILLFRRIWFFGDIVGGGKQRRLMSGEFPWIILVQASICVSIVVFAGPMVYFVGWFVPLFSLMPLLEHVRVVAEHHQTALRVFVSPNPIERWVFGRFGFASHGYHHKDPRLRWFELSKESSPDGDSSPLIVNAHSWLREFAWAMR
jgi:fatty acid desaturase